MERDVPDAAAAPAPAAPQPAAQQDMPQNMDVVAMFKPITKWATPILHPDSIPEVVRKAFKVATSITFDNEGSDIYTIIEVDTRDRPGLLHDLTRTLAASNVYVANAVIATYGEQVVDTFYVKDMFGLKYFSESKQKVLEKRLRAAIEEGVERAADGA